MNRLTIIDNEHLTLWYYPDEKIVHHRLHQYFTGQALREGLTRGAEVLEAHRAQKWLSDDRNSSALHPEDRKWGDNVWFPRVVRAGWKYWALMLPKKAIGQMSMKRVVSFFYEHGITTKMFSDPDEGMRWLRRQPMVPVDPSRPPVELVTVPPVSK